MAKRNLKNFVEDSLSKRKYDELPDKLGVTQYKVTNSLNNPTKIDANMLEGLSKELNTTPEYLIENFDVGVDEITIKEYKNIINKKK